MQFDGVTRSAKNTEALAVDWVDLGRASLRYVHLGQGLGNPIVVLHEMGGSLETWDMALPLLAQSHEVIAYDWRGFGYSEQIRGDITLDDHVADLAALLDARGLTGPVVLAGCAVGAAIIGAFAAAYPDRAAGLVMLCPALGVPPESRTDRLKQIDVFEKGGMRAAVVASLGGGYPDQFREKNMARFENFRARWLANDPASFAANYRMLVNMDIEPILAALKCPVLLVAGEYDPVRTPEYVGTVATQIENSEMISVAGGHHIPHQIPEIIAEVILKFTTEHSAKGAD